MICLSLTGDTLASWSEELERNRPWVSLVEFRVDLLRPAERNPEQLRRWWRGIAPPLPVVLTIRRSRDGGHWEGDEAQRAFLLEALVDALHPDYVEIDLDRRGAATWDALAMRVRAAGGTVLRSHCEPRETPESPSRIMARLAAEPREIPRLVVRMHSLDDLGAFLAAADEFSLRMPGRRALWIGMGDAGLLTRVFPARLGSSWTYGVDGERVRASCQEPVRKLHEVYRGGEAQRDWHLFAVLGNPVAHSRSPEYHNSRFLADRRRAIYIPLRVSDFSRFPALAEQLNLRGASVTVPHKESALKLASPGNDAALLRRVGAANTLLRGADGTWRAENTDIPGFLDPLEERMTSLEGVRTAVIGAGGTARSVVAALRERTSDLHIFNRTVARAAGILEEMELPPSRAYSLADLESWQGAPFDLVVQTTSVGMQEDDPVPGYSFRGTETVYDIIYTPPETPLLARARAAGCRTINGQAMFERQAELQYSLFTGLIDVLEASR